MGVNSRIPILGSVVLDFFFFPSFVDLRNLDWPVVVGGEESCEV